MKGEEVHEASSCATEAMGLVLDELALLADGMLLVVFKCTGGCCKC